MLKELSTQDRTIVKGAYTFNEKAHLHTLDGKPLTGVTTILGVIAKPMLIQWAANMAVDHIEKKFGDFTFDPEASVRSVVNAYTDYLLPLFKEARVAHRKKKESAGEFGTNVHSAIEKWINAQMLGVQVEVVLEGMEKKAFDHFVKWAIDNKVKFLESEKHVYSRSLWVGGIVDIVCEIDGKRYVADIKTSSGIYPEAMIQTSAYAKFLEEMGEYPKTTYQIEGDEWLYEKPAFDGVLILNCNKKGGFEHAFNYDIEGNFECFKAATKLYRHLNAITK